MRKDQSRSTLNTRCTSLPRNKILRGKRNFERLFKQSSVLHSSSLQFRYHFFENTDNEIKIGFITPKKIMKKAVSRNKTKRRLRESYRQHQHILTNFFSGRSGGVHGVFISKKESSPYCDIDREMKHLLINLTDQLSSRRDMRIRKNHQTPIK